MHANKQEKNHLRDADREVNDLGCSESTAVSVIMKLSHERLFGVINFTAHEVYLTLYL